MTKKNKPVINLPGLIEGRLNLAIYTEESGTAYLNYRTGSIEFTAISAFNVSMYTPIMKKAAEPIMLVSRYGFRLQADHRQLKEEKNRINEQNYCPDRASSVLSFFLRRLDAT